MPLPATFVPDAPASFVPDAAPETPASFVPDVQVGNQPTPNLAETLANAPYIPPELLSPFETEEAKRTEQMLAMGAKPEPLPTFGESVLGGLSFSPFLSAVPQVNAADPRMRMALRVMAPYALPEVSGAGLNLLKGFGEFATSPLGPATAGAGTYGGPLVKALLGLLFGGTLAKGGAEQLGEATVTKDPQQLLEGALTLATAPVVAAGGMPRAKVPTAPVKPVITPEVELPYVSEAAALGYREGRWNTLTRGQRQKVMDQLRTRGMIAPPVAEPAPVAPQVPAIPMTIEQRKEREKTVADADLAALEKTGVLSAAEARPTPEPIAITTQLPDVRNRISELDREILEREPDSFVAMQNARVQRKLTDGQYLALLEEWKRRQSAQRPGAGQTERQPPAETAPPSTLLADATAPIGAEALAQTGLPHPPMRPGPGVEELKLPAIGAPAQPIGVPNAEAVRSGEGRVAEQGLLVKEREKARSDDIQRPPPGPPVEAAPEEEVNPLGVSTEIRTGRTAADVENDRAKDVGRRTTLSLLKDLGLFRPLRGPLSSHSNKELVDLRHAVDAVYSKLRKQGVPSRGGEDARVLAERVAVHDELTRRLDKALGLRKQALTQFEEGMEHPLPPEFAKREQELRGPFQLSSVDIATDPAKLGFADLQKPIDAVQMRGRIRNKVTPTEWEMVKDALPEQGRISPMEAAKLMQEAGPRVEIRKEGKESTVVTEAERQRIALVHELDTVLPNYREYWQAGSPPSPSWKPELQEKYNKLLKLQKIVEDYEAEHGPMGRTNWSSIAPKPESEMPGYVEIAVVKPLAREKGGYKIVEFAPGKFTVADKTGKLIDKNQYYKTAEEAQRMMYDFGGELAQFPSTHQFPPNTLAFVRGYMEGDTFHIIEVQSDWAEQVRDREQSRRRANVLAGRAEDAPPRFGPSPSEPLLQHYERLALKAAIDHARAQGAKRVAVQDAESAMMTEGHDRGRTLVRATPENIEGAKRSAGGLRRQGGNQPNHIAMLDEIASGKDVNVGSAAQLFGSYGLKLSPTQEPGMRLHYDTILPRIMEELTGTKGEKVSFGEHKMAFTGDYVNGRPEQLNKPRPDLIFRNPDGTPKTDVTAMSFPIERAAKEFTLTGRDRPVGEHAAPPAPSAIPVEQKTHLEQMGLLDKATGAFREGRTAQDVVEEIATRPDAEKVLGRDRVVLAKWLAENMGHVLERYSVEAGPGAAGRAGANTDVRKVFLSIGDADPMQMTDRFLHEAAHAAFEFQLLYPRTKVQTRAAMRVDDIMRQAWEQVPEHIRTFYDEKIKPLMEKDTTNEEWLDVLNEMESRKTDEWFPRLYALDNPSEFAAMVWRDRTSNVAKWLNSWEYRGTKLSAFQVLWNTVKEIFGAEPGTALSASLDAIMSLSKEHGEDVFTGKLWKEGKRYVGYDTGSANMAPLAVMSAGMERAVPPAAPGTAPTIKARDFRERARAFTNKLAGYAMPRLAAADVDAANAGVRYGSARIAAPLVAKYLATQVLGPHWKDGAFTRVLGDVLIEDRLRAIKQAWWEAAQDPKNAAHKAEYEQFSRDVQSIVGKPEYALRTETQYQALLRNPEFKAAIERHKNIVQPLAESQQVETHGKLARPGEETGAFVNLMAILAPDDVEGTRAMIYASRKGDITNPLRRGSVFSKTAYGTAQLYERSYRTLAERMIRGNYEQTALRHFYTALEATGLAVEARPGVPPPKDAKGNPSRKLTIEIRGGGPGMTRQRNLWIRPDIYDEVRHAIAVDDPLARSTALRHVAQALTEIQVAGATDAVYHTANMTAAIVTAQGGRNMLVDIARKFPGINVLDAVSRVVHQAIRVAMDSPEVQREMAQIAEVGAGRSERVHKGMATQGLQKVFGEPGKYLDPSFWSSRFIRTVDKAGRLALNSMFDNLVGRGLAEDSPMARREFINRMGQYNERLMPRYDSFLRESSISSFIVAGKNFNRLALQRFLLDPGVMAATPEAWWKMRAIEAVGAIASVGALAYVANQAITGTPWGRPGTPAGAIDTGKDDKDGAPFVIDPLQLSLWRRAFRGSGLQAYARARERKMSGKDTAKEVLTDMFNFAVHPYAGPSVRTAKIAVTGYDTSGYLVSRNPEDPFENAWAALKNSNPMTASYFRGQESARIGESKSKEGWKEIGRSLAAATGIGKRGRVPTFNEQVVTRTGKQPDELPLAERRAVSKEIHTERLERPNINELARRSSALRNLAEGFAEEDVLRSRVAPDVRKFLDEHELRLPAFQRELTIGKVGIPLTQSEKDRFEDYVVEEYNKRIKAFVPYLPKERSRWQEALNMRLDLARARARTRLRSSMVKPVR